MAVNGSQKHRIAGTLVITIYVGLIRRSNIAAERKIARNRFTDPTEIVITKVPAFRFFPFAKAVHQACQSGSLSAAARYLTRGTKTVKKGGQKGGHSWFISLKHAILFRPA
jgi:hypothetical protein